MKPIYTEQEVREQRDKVYGHKISDAEWDKCKNNWMKDIEWLFSQPTES